MMHHNLTCFYTVRQRVPSSSKDYAETRGTLLSLDKLGTLSLSKRRGVLETSIILRRRPRRGLPTSPR
jgi:hypothetical protein